MLRAFADALTRYRNGSVSYVKLLDGGLVDNFGLSSENLVTVGYGKQRPKNIADPFSPENRRVQVVNLDSQTQALR